MEYAAGLQDFGNFSLNIDIDDTDAGHIALRAAKTAASTKAFKLRLPNGKLPDRHDFVHYGNDLAGRVKAWQAAVSAAEQLCDEFQAWLAKPDMNQVHSLQ